MAGQTGINGMITVHAMHGDADRCASKPLLQVPDFACLAQSPQQTRPISRQSVKKINSRLFTNPFDCNCRPEDWTTKLSFEYRKKQSLGQAFHLHIFCTFRTIFCPVKFQLRAERFVYKTLTSRSLKVFNVFLTLVLFLHRLMTRGPRFARKNDRKYAETTD